MLNECRTFGPAPEALDRLAAFVATRTNSACLSGNPDYSAGRAIPRIVWLLSLIMLLPAAVHAQDFTYTVNGGTVTITGYTGPGGAVVIPGTIEGFPVTVIGTQAFSGNATLTSVTIPDSVINIGTEAFYSCLSLTSVAIPNSVTSIGEGAFEACPSLASVTIPNSVTSLGNWAFSNCISLASVTIPNSVTSLGIYAFYNCTSLSGVTIGNGVTSIGYRAFAHCSSLTSITVDAANPAYSSDEAGVLFNKNQTTLLQCPGRKAGSYTVPSSVTSIGKDAFYYCTNLANVIIPSSVTTIGGFAFYSCNNLTEITIPQSVISVGDYAFYDCSSLASVTIPDSVTIIGIYAFAHCSRLTDVYFKGNAPALGDTSVLSETDDATVYYLPGATGWGPTFGGRPTVLWNPTPQITGPSDPFSFTITGSENLVIVVEAATSLSNPDWTPVSTNTLTGGSSPFSDPQWANHPARYYRLRSP